MSTHEPGFQSNFRFLHHYVLAKLATTSISVNIFVVFAECDPFNVECQWKQKFKEWCSQFDDYRSEFTKWRTCVKVFSIQF